jgi:hypothetical protein
LFNLNHLRKSYLFVVHLAQTMSLMVRTVGKMYEYEPKVWDPQAAVETIKPTFSSPHGSLPHWLRWDNTGTKLVGVADCPSNPFTVEVIADVSQFQIARTHCMLISVSR